MDEFKDVTLAKQKVIYIYQLWKKEDETLRAQTGNVENPMPPARYSMHVGLEFAYRNILGMCGINPDNVTEVK